MGEREATDKFAGELIKGLLGLTQEHRDEFYWNSNLGPEMVKATRELLHFYEDTPT